MTDNAITEQTGVTNTAREWFSGIALAISATVIGYTTLYGKADNSLQASSLSWAWSVVIVILVGAGFTAITPALLASVRGK